MNEEMDESFINRMIEYVAMNAPVSAIDACRLIKMAKINRDPEWIKQLRDRNVELEDFVGMVSRELRYMHRGVDNRDVGILTEIWDQANILKARK